MFAIGPATGVQLATGVTDLRKGFNGLYSAIKHGLGRDPLTGGEAFVFCNRRRDTVKIFFVDRDGMDIATKFLGHGTVNPKANESDDLSQ